MRRELREELAIEISKAAPLMRFRHDYSHRSVVLDTWRVTAWAGEPQGCEGQVLRWLPVQRFAEVSPLLPTVVPIERALRTPQHYVFTPPQLPLTALLAGLAGLPCGAWLRLRQPALDEAQYEAIAAVLIPAAQAQGLAVMLDRDPHRALRLGADGWHARSALLMQLEARPALPLVIASVHTSAELAQVVRLGVDAAVLGPVCATPTHPGAAVLGWPGFSALRGTAALPVFAIGGLAPAALATAVGHNAQGLAGISAYWA